MKTNILVLTALLIVFCLSCSNSPTENTRQESETKPVEITENSSNEMEVKQVVLQEEKNVAPINKKEAIQKVVANAKELSPQSKREAKMKIEQEPKRQLKTETKKQSTTEIKINQPEVADSEEKVVESKSQIPEKPQLPSAPSHKDWDALLSKYVSSSGKVNYKGIKSEQGKLDAYLKALADNPVQSTWSRNEKMVYWINAYNAFTVKLIVDNFPVSSIMKLHNGKPWDVKWIKLGDKTYSLNNIEHDILRPKYKDARIHFAVNCAAQSCPPLLNRAWTADNLNRYFNQQAKNFINNTKYNSISADKVELSKIFEWYGSDFGELITYLNKYSNTKINGGAEIIFQEYDWALNN